MTAAMAAAATSVGAGAAALVGPGDLAVAAVTGLAVATCSYVLFPPTPRLAARVRRYTVASRTSLGGRADLAGLDEPVPARAAAALRRRLAPLVDRLARLLGDAVDTPGDAALLLALRQAGLLGEVAEAHRAHEYRIRQLRATAGFAGAFAAAALLVGLRPGLVALLGGLGFVAGVTRWRARLDRAISARRERMGIELYTVNHLLAMHVRVGGGVVQAITRVVERGQGPVVDELGEVLRAHRGGRRLSEALEQAACTTPEPNAARTYRLLANGVEYGADLADGLRALSADIRSQRIEALKRSATRRRAAMLVPIIAILAPIMLLFIAAPLPSLILGGL